MKAKDGQRCYWRSFQQVPPVPFYAGESDADASAGSIGRRCLTILVDGNKRTAIASMAAYLAGYIPLHDGLV
jgi:hypothetical protein